MVVREGVATERGLRSLARSCRFVPWKSFASFICYVVRFSPVVKQHATQQPRPYHSWCRRDQSQTTTQGQQSIKKNEVRNTLRIIDYRPCSQCKILSQGNKSCSYPNRSGSRSSLSGVWAAFFSNSRTRDDEIWRAHKVGGRYCTE